jgi:hypothetical protein
LVVKGYFSKALASLLSEHTIPRPREPEIL